MSTCVDQDGLSGGQFALRVISVQISVCILGRGLVIACDSAPFQKSWLTRIQADNIISQLAARN